MNKFQNVNFRSIADFFDHLPSDEALIVVQLRDLIKATLPEVTEKLSYNVPFYKRHKNICYLWPGAVPWGNVKEGV
jgi:uncharacterized protein YdhG (YjbR/CyaY superfamily)